jgi:alkyldihydroxyacetonephosphate synthase
MPYWRDETTRRGAILDTFESAVTWSGFDAFYEGVKLDVADAIERITGSRSNLSCRFTHVYPDGVLARGNSQGDIASSLARWREIKHACNAAVVRHGGASTHHHAVGRDHRGGYEVETPELYRRALAGAKATLDPQGILNPGVLFDPVGRKVGITGSLAEA